MGVVGVWDEQGGEDDAGTVIFMLFLGEGLHVFYFLTFAFDV